MLLTGPFLLRARVEGTEHDHRAPVTYTPRGKRCVNGTDGSKWMYVQALSTIAQNRHLRCFFRVGWVGTYGVCPAAGRLSGAGRWGRDDRRRPPPALQQRYRDPEMARKIVEGAGVLQRAPQGPGVRSFCQFCQRHEAQYWRRHAIGNSARM